MLVHQSWLDRHETQFVMQTLRDQIWATCFSYSSPRSPYIRCFIICSYSNVANLLCYQFEQKQVENSYLKIVRGYITGQGRIDSSLKVQRDKNRG